MVARKTPKNKGKKHRTKVFASSSGKCSTELAAVGLPGVPQCIVVRPHYSDPDDPRNSGGPIGWPGEYTAVFTFSRPGFPLLPENQCCPAQRLEGNSHLAIAAPAYRDPIKPDTDHIRLYAQVPGGSFVFNGYPNSKGFLGKIELGPFSADSFSDAGLIAHRALSSGLSNIAVYLDIPLHIYQADITELRTGSVSMSISTAYREVPLCRIPTGAMTADFRAYASLYREALNADSPAYQFLCYYRIIEGIRKRQARLVREAKARGEQVQSAAKQVVPADRREQVRWLESIFPLPQTWDAMTLDQIFPQCTLGRGVFDVVVKEMRCLRNRIAHFVLDSGELTILTDEGDDVSVVVQWLQFTKCIARFLIKTEFPTAFDR